MPNYDADANFFQCTCKFGYIGTTCQTYSGCNIVSLQCLNGGTCNSQTGTCACATGYTGTTCQTCKLYIS